MSNLQRSPSRALVLVFWLTVFLNAALLFSIQPLFTKMVLPLLGGTPAVWNTCLLFFQAALLAGYLYAHATSRWLSIQSQALLHMAVLIAAIFVMPIGISDARTIPPASTSPITWLIGLLTVSLGLPFVALAAGAPMLQRWFAGTRHPSAHNPYFLYASSNLGSFAALLAYPFVIEPRLAISQQSMSWFRLYYGLLVLVALSAICAFVMRQRTASSAPVSDVDVGGDLTWPQRTRWVLLSLAPSSLLIGVTTYFTTDIASVPFLWVLPLAIYLLTFVLAFARRQLIPQSLVVHAQLVLGLVLVVALCVRSEDAIVGPALFHLVAFFVTALMCHSLLASSRPHSSHLTEFYLWISVGGVLGGAFNVLAAPVLFDGVPEYAIALSLAFALRPGFAAHTTRVDRTRDVLYPLVLATVIWLVYQSPFPPDEWFANGTLLFLLIAMFVVFFFWKRPIRLALGALALFATTQVAATKPEDVLFQDRTFFGTYRVRRYGDYNVLQHGTTTHGAQYRDPAHRAEPLTYYYRGGPLSDVFETQALKSVRRIGIVGLGAGGIACYGREGEPWTFYEIDPAIERIARTPRLFTFLQDCAPTIDVILGDARQRLASAGDGEFDLIVVDAFSSDAVPTHLLTREAWALYLRKLRPDGSLVFHISNRFMDLRPVLHAVADDAELAGAVGERFPDQAGIALLHGASRWVVVSRQTTTIAALLAIDGWQALDTSPRTRLWTDDYSDVLSVLRW